MLAVSSRNTAPLLRRFARNDRGTVAILFGLSIIPVLVCAGAAMDYSIAVNEKERIQHALDAAALAVAHEPRNAPIGQIQIKAENFFRAGFDSVTRAPPPVLTVERDGGNIRLAATGSMQTSFMALAGVNSITLRAASTVRNERRKLEIALVLDNTGSMGGSGKMPALKAAVGDLITRLQARSTEPGDVKMSIVPFNTEVKTSTDYFNASWLRWGVRLENPHFGYTGSLPPTPSTWAGCLSDRDQPADISGAPPYSEFTNYVASQCHFPGLVEMSPLTANLELIRSRANSMTPTGNTNVTVGFTMGLATLRSDSPFGSAAGTTADTQKFMIVLTDGDNTMNRWTSNASEIDARLTASCVQARTAGVQIFTIRVIAGNAALLRSCASNPSMFYDIRNASELQPVFRSILEAIEGIRITA